MRTLLIFTTLAVLTGATGSAEPLDSLTAHLEMHKRIEAAVMARAARLGVGKDVVIYCQIELLLHTRGHPINGKLPYGVDYRTLTSAAELAKVIAVREAYERNYLLLCLARAHQDLALETQ